MNKKDQVCELKDMREVVEKDVGDLKETDLSQNHEKSLLYANEKSFKINVTSNDGFEATLEGCHLHEPLRSLIIGRYINEQEN